MTTRTIIKSIAAVCLAVIAMAVFPSCRTYAGDAVSTDWLNGVWLGTARTSKGQPYMVSLTVDPSNPKKNAIFFGEPMACKLYINDAVQDGDSAVLNLKDGTGGFCDRFLGGSARAQQVPGEDHHTILTLKDRSGSYKVQTYLTRSEDAPKAAPPAVKTEKAPKAKTK